MLEGVLSKDLEIKKMAIDVAYTMAVILPEKLSPYKDHFLEALNDGRYDK